MSNYGRPLVPGDLTMPWGWSLALEEQFYLAVPLLVVLLYKLRGDAARLAALGAALGVAALHTPRRSLQPSPVERQ